MFEFLHQRRVRRARDTNDARIVIAEHGERAIEVVRARSADESRSQRYREHWQRVERLVEQRLDA